MRRSVNGQVTTSNKNQLERRQLVTIVTNLSSLEIKLIHFARETFSFFSRMRRNMFAISKRIKLHDTSIAECHELIRYPQS